MQNRPTKHEPQLSEEAYLHLLQMHAKLSEAKSELKAKKNEAHAIIENAEEGVDLITMISVMMLKAEYAGLKHNLDAVNHQLIFHSQDAVAKLYASKSGMFTTPTSSAQSREEKSQSLSHSQSSLTDSDEYASHEHSHSQSDEEYSSPRMGRGSSH
jgi:hypothetical protein